MRIAAAFGSSAAPVLGVAADLSAMVNDGGIKDGLIDERR